MSRSCDTRCHQARKPVCRCWCGGAFHGQAGAINRQALYELASDPAALKAELEKHGFAEGLTRYIDRLKLAEAQR